MDGFPTLRRARVAVRLWAWFVVCLLASSVPTAAQQQTRGIGARRSMATGTRRAVVIGVSKYGQLPADRQLAYAAADARLFAAFLTSKAGGPLLPENVRLLVDTAATAGRIWEALAWLQQSSTANDEAIVYFAGHGDVEEATGAETGYLLAYDAPVGRMYPAGGAISIHDLQQTAAGLARKGAHVILVTDACRAGKLVGTPEGAARTTSALLADWTNTTRLVSSQANQLSREGPQWGGGHGVFTYYLIDGLLGAANSDGDQAVTRLEIKRYLLDEVSRATSDQQVPEVLGELEQPMAIADAASRQLVLGPYHDSSAVAVITPPTRSAPPSEVEARYASVRARIERGDLLNPPDSSAWELLRRSGPAQLPNAQRAQLAAMLSTALLNDAQEVINTYIRGGNNLPSPARFREAAREIDVAQGELDKVDPRLPSLRALKTFLEGYAFVRQGKPTYAIPILKRSLALERTAHAMNGLAAAYVNAGRADSAQPLLLAIVKEMPRWAYRAYPLNSLGTLYHRQERFDDAVRMFELSIAADSTYGKAYANLGRTLLRLGRKEEAFRLWDRALAVDPENSADLIARFFIVDQKNLAAADSVYERAIASAPTSLLTMVRKGDLQKLAGKLNEAEREYRRALTAAPDYALAFSGLGSLYQARFDEVGDSTLLDSAAAAFEKARSLEPQNPIFERNAGIIAGMRGRVAFADSALRRAIRLDSLDADSYAALGWLLGERKRYREAAAAYEHAIRLDPRNVDLYLGLAAQREEASEFAAAERVYRRALAIVPRSAAVFTALGDLYRKWNRRADAARSYRTALEIDPEATAAKDGLEALKAPKPAVPKPVPNESTTSFPLELQD